jgi:hypothetical protein
LLVTAIKNDASVEQVDGGSVIDPIMARTHSALAAHTSSMVGARAMFGIQQSWAAAPMAGRDCE